MTGDCQPKNLEMIMSVLQRPCHSPDFGQQEFRDYNRNMKAASNEKEIEYVLPPIVK